MSGFDVAFVPVRTVIISVVGRLPVSRNLWPKRAFMRVDLPEMNGQKVSVTIRFFHPIQEQYMIMRLARIKFPRNNDRESRT